MKKAFGRNVAAVGFALACVIVPVAAQAQVGVALTFGPTYYTPPVAPVAYTAAMPYGCPAYSAGQWSWTGYDWTWCPTTAYIPIGASALVGTYGFTPAIPPPSIAVAPAYYEPPAYYASDYAAPSVGFYGSATPGLNFFVGLDSLPLAPQPAA
ncbi:MAG TPA: hypothetical protein VFE36_06860, partial [Candidatus Baltobacteraceae bacterium]|nr:hypothetical protein [Candidatus Baltobacteraceae bacterium]